MTLDAEDIDRLTTHPLPPMGIVSIGPIALYRAYLALLLNRPTLDDDDTRALIAAHNRRHGDRA